MDDLKEGCGCFIASLVIVGIFWIFVNVSSGGSSNYSAPTNPTYTTPKPAPTYTPPTINYPSRPVVPEPSYSTSSRSETPDDAYDNGYDDSSDYYNYYETRYQEGYESGYADGYYEGKSKYEDEQEDEQEDEEEGW